MTEQNDSYRRKFLQSLPSTIEDRQGWRASSQRVPRGSENEMAIG